MNADANVFVPESVKQEEEWFQKRVLEFEESNKWMFQIDFVEKVLKREENKPQVKLSYAKVARKQ
jgi:hypothetical protein